MTTRCFGAVTLDGSGSTFSRRSNQLKSQRQIQSCNRIEKARKNRGFLDG